MPRSATLRRSPVRGKKWRVVLSPGNAVVDFGAAGMEDYTTHGDARRMARYVRRHGGLTAAAYAATKRLSTPELRRRLRAARASSKEDWADPRTPGFWSRWLLWSEPTLARAARRVPGVRIRDPVA